MKKMTIEDEFMSLRENCTAFPDTKLSIALEICAKLAIQTKGQASIVNGEINKLHQKIDALDRHYGELLEEKNREVKFLRKEIRRLQSE
jgi:hypothetical protein